MKTSNLPMFLPLWLLIVFVAGLPADIQCAGKNTGQKTRPAIAPKTAKPLQIQKQELKTPHTPRRIPVPDLSGKTKTEAKKILKKFKLKLGDVTFRSVSRGKKGTIIAQSPGPEAKVKKGEPKQRTRG